MAATRTATGAFVENEFNYVLHDPDRALARALDAMPGVTRLDVVQGYIGDNRIRRFRDLDTGATSYLFSFKRKSARSGLVREVEREIDRDTFEDLYHECETRLRKVRYAFEAEGSHWDVDFIRDRKGRTYFVKAEAEVAADVARAPEPCGALAPYVVAVPGKRKGFSSRRLADEDYARALIKGILQLPRRSERRAGLRMAA